MRLASMQDLLLHELKDLLSAEKQLIRALPKMAKAAKAEHLRNAIEMHLEETKTQVQRLEQVFQMLEKKPRAEKCDAMEGLIKESEKLIEEEGEDSVKDAALIGAAQRVEHYEIASYGCARTFAEMLGLHQAAELLQISLDEEKAADEKLNELATSEINVQAQHS